MGLARAILIWAALATALAAPLGVAAASPLLAWRDPIYVAAGFAGAAALTLLLLQPLLAGGYLPSVPPRRGRRAHAFVGIGLVAVVALHVVGLWLTSPPDVVDALLFRSPTPFAAWGVVALWAVFAAALLAAFRRRLRLAPMIWRLCHTTLATVIVLGSVVHAMLIEGTMGMATKATLCALLLAAMAMVMVDLPPWSFLFRRKACASAPAHRSVNGLAAPTLDRSCTRPLEGQARPSP